MFKRRKSSSNAARVTIHGEPDTAVGRARRAYLAADPLDPTATITFLAAMSNPSGPDGPVSAGGSYPECWRCRRRARVGDERQANGPLGSLVDAPRLARSLHGRGPLFAVSTGEAGVSYPECGRCGAASTGLDAGLCGDCRSLPGAMFGAAPACAGCYNAVHACGPCQCGKPTAGRWGCASCETVEFYDGAVHTRKVCTGGCQRAAARCADCIEVHYGSNRREWVCGGGCMDT